MTLRYKADEVADGTVHRFDKRYPQDNSLAPGNQRSYYPGLHQEAYEEDQEQTGCDPHAGPIPAFRKGQSD